MDVAAAKLLVEAVKGRDISLCGIQPDQTTADFSGSGKPNFERLKPPDAVVLLVSDPSKAGVSGAANAEGVSQWLCTLRANGVVV